MAPIKNIPDKAHSSLDKVWQRWGKRLPSWGFFVLAAVLLLLAALACIDLSPREHLYVAGETAAADVTADRGFLFEDAAATQAKRDQAAKMQPLVLTLVTEPVDELRNQIQQILIQVNREENAADKEALRQQISQEIGEELSPSAMSTLALPDVQAAASNTLLPSVEAMMRGGVLPEMRLILSYRGGVIIRNLASGEETLHPDAQGILDLKSVEVQLSQQIKQLSISGQGKRALSQVFSNLLRPTLVPNYEATTIRATLAKESVTPVVHRVLRGESIVRQGDTVSPEQQLKMQVLWSKRADRFNGSMFLGVAACGLLLSMGLLFSPSGKTGSSMGNRDHIFLAVLVALFALMAKGFAILGAQLAASSLTFIPESLAYAVPVAGAASLSSLVFSTRRYLVTGLLLSFFCTIMSNGGIGLFLFYFLASMWSTWLTGRTSTRQDVVWSILPLTLGLFAMWLGATFLQGGAHTRYLSEAISVLGGAVFSMILTFALAPVVEMVFSYTTRFRLMELLNLEQPLLRDLMLNAPGTYHHSLIVSNMVEEGAKTIGAQSLLCKVAALYHDIGKISKASYFIENQLTEDNPHNRLAPSMSALILISHAKQGTELGLQYRLGREVTDIITQHHGTSLIQYFYQKAQNQVDTVPPKIEDFSYPGPKPQSREAALVMLADAVEASSRTLNDPSPNRLRQHIESIIKKIYSTGQLDESELTFRDLTVLADSFHRVLRGLFHHRIAYPDKIGSEKSGKHPQPKAPEQPAPYAALAVSGQNGETGTPAGLRPAGGQMAGGQTPVPPGLQGGTPYTPGTGLKTGQTLAEDAEPHPGFSNPEPSSVPQ